MSLDRDHQRLWIPIAYRHALLGRLQEGVHLQVAEERYLAGICGSAACPNEKSLASGKGRLQHDGESGFCR